MAKRTGARASEWIGIGCDFCAYAFDEALLIRESAHLERLNDEAEEKARMDELRREAEAEMGRM